MHVRRTSALHAHRWSEPASTYFVTWCTRFRAIGLTKQKVACAIRTAAATLDATGDVTTLAFTVMPDHVHWLFELGPRLSLGRLIARLKVETGPALKETGLTWQRDFFEHRLRGEEKIEALGLYVFLNPYRAALLDEAATWPYWWCPRPEVFRFTARLDSSGAPPAEWIGAPAPKGLPVGD